MDLSNNPLQRILDLTHSDHNLHSFINNQNSYPLDSFSLFPINHDSKHTQKNDFSPLSPNLFKNQRKNSLQFAYEFKNHCSSNQYHLNRRFIFDQDENVSKWNCIQKQSQFPLQQISYSIKKTDISQTPYKCKNQSFEQKYCSLQDIKLSKHQRGLKSLSQIIFNILKKNDKATFNIVAQLLVENFKTKSSQEGRQLQQKAQKNIRRRTYDALNVLISAGIVEKVGKNINLNLKKKNDCKQKRQARNHVTKKQLFLQQMKQQLQQKIKLKFLLLKKKQQQYHSLLERKKNIKRFFENKKIEENININDDVKNCDDNQNERIQFPFLCIKTRQEKFVKFTQQNINKNTFGWDKDNSSTCDQYKEQKVVNLYFNSPNIHQCFVLEGDVDFISNLGNMMVQKSKV